MIGTYALFAKEFFLFLAIEDRISYRTLFAFWLAFKLSFNTPAKIFGRLNDVAVSTHAGFHCPGPQTITTKILFGIDTYFARSSVETVMLISPSKFFQWLYDATLYACTFCWFLCLRTRLAWGWGEEGMVSPKNFTSLSTIPSLFSRMAGFAEWTPPCFSLRISRELFQWFFYIASLTNKRFHQSPLTVEVGC
jgi:hypothetical protein